MSSSALFKSRALPRVCAEKKYCWTFDNRASNVRDKKIKSLPLKSIKRPLRKTKINDPDKVKALMLSIAEIGLQEPIDVLEVDGEYYGFSGCHRFEACEKLEMKQINCRVRKATKSTLKMHFM